MAGQVASSPICKFMVELKILAGYAKNPFKKLNSLVEGLIFALIAKNNTRVKNILINLSL